MIGLDVVSSDEIKRLYNKALDLGETCEGEANVRNSRFSAYVRDLDKNKICFFE